MLRKGHRVQYQGTITPRLRDCFGTVINPHNRNGWIVVQFDGDLAPSACSPLHLVRIPRNRSTATGV